MEKDDLESIIELLQNLLAIELLRGGLSKEKIREHLGIAQGTVNEMLKGIKKENL